MINPNFTLDNEIDRLVNQDPELKKEIDSLVKNNKDYIKRFEKDNHKVEIGISSGDSVIPQNQNYYVLHFAVQGKGSGAKTSKYLKKVFQTWTY